MKKLTTLTAAAALIAGMSFAHAAEHAAKGTTAAGSINAGVQTGTGDTKSGSETKGTAMMKKSTKKMTKEEKASKGQAKSGSINAGMQTGTGDNKSGSQSKATVGMGAKKSGAKEPTGTPPQSSLNSGVQKGTGDTKSGSQQ